MSRLTINFHPKHGSTNNKQYIIKRINTTHTHAHTQFATKNLLELGGDECDNLNFMNYKIDSFKFRKNS